MQPTSSQTDSPRLTFHEELEKKGIELPEPISRAIREADMEMPGNMKHSLEAIERIAPLAVEFLDKDKKQGGFREMRRQFSMMRKTFEKIGESERFEGLPFVYKMHAIKSGGVRAKMADREKDADLFAVAEEAAHEVNAKYKVTRIIVIDSDFPQAAATIIPAAGGHNDIKRRKPFDPVVTKEGQQVLWLTTDLLDRLSRTQLKAFVGHELHEMEEIKDTPVKTIRGVILSKLGRPRMAHEREYRADDRGAMTEGGPQALAEALEILEARQQELKKFLLEAQAAAKKGMREIMPKQSIASKFGDKIMQKLAQNKLNDHPLTASRVERLRQQKPPGEDTALSK